MYPSSDIDYPDFTLKLHSKHKFFDKNKIHLKIIITSQSLKKMDRITAHKKIFSLLKDDFKEKIHALELEIK